MLPLFHRGRPANSIMATPKFAYRSRSILLIRASSTLETHYVNLARRYPGGFLPCSYDTKQLANANSSFVEGCTAINLSYVVSV